MHETAGHESRLWIFDQIDSHGFKGKQGTNVPSRSAASRRKGVGKLREPRRRLRTVSLQIKVHNADTSREIIMIFASSSRDRPDALLIGGGPLFTARRVQLTQLAAFS
jgi:hypothetical protein